MIVFDIYIAVFFFPVFIGVLLQNKYYLISLIRLFACSYPWFTVITIVRMCNVENEYINCKHIFSMITEQIKIIVYKLIIDRNCGKGCTPVL